MMSRVTEKGQVTIPKELRSRFGIRPGEEMAFREEDGHIVLEKAPRPGRFDHLYGIVKLDKPTDDLIDEMRGTVDRS